MVELGDDPARHRPGTPGYRRLNVAMLGAGLAAFGLLYAPQALLPEIAEAYDVTPATASLTISASTGALALAVVPVTILALRWGTVRSMRVSLLVAVLLGLACAVAPSFGVLVGLRAVLGLVLAGVVALAMGHVGAEVHPRGLGAAMGLYVAGNTLGGVGGRLIGAAAADLGTWRWGLAMVAGLALAAVALFWWMLPAPLDRRPAAQRRTMSAGALRRLVGDRAVVALIAMPFLLMGGFVAVYNYLTFRLVDEPFALPVTLVGLVFLAYLAGTGSSMTAGAWADRVGRPRVLAVALVVMAAGLALTVPDALVAVVGGLVVFTAGFFAAHAVGSGWAPVLGGAEGSQASALYVCAYYAGSGIFGTLVGVAWHAFGWTGVVVWVGVLIAVAAVCGGLVVRWVRPAAGGGGFPG